MGQVHADIILKNAGDRTMVERGLIKDPKVRETTVRAMVDTGALALTITEPVEVHWKDRSTSCWAVVVPGEGEVLLGAIPLEGMDLMVDPVSQQLIGAHGDQPLLGSRLSPRRGSWRR